MKPNGRGVFTIGLKSLMNLKSIPERKITKLFLNILIGAFNFCDEPGTPPPVGDDDDIFFATV